jgi:hypothetical protein
MEKSKIYKLLDERLETSHEAINVKIAYLDIHKEWQIDIVGKGYLFFVGIYKTRDEAKKIANIVNEYLISKHRICVDQSVIKTVIEQKDHIRDATKMIKPENKQVGGTHYKSDIECWDYIIANQLGYLEGCAIKYVTRHKSKGGRADILKAIHYLEKILEVEYKGES